MSDSKTSLPRLIAACRRGEVRAQESFYRRYFPLLLPVCQRYLGSRQRSVPILNEAMLRIFRSLDAYEEIGKLEGWLVEITRRTVLNHIRDEARAQRRLTDRDFSWPVSVANQALDKLAVEDILKLLDRLPDHLRLVFSLTVFDGYSHAEIAEELGISVTASRWRLKAARELLQQRYTATHTEKQCGT